MSIRIRWVFLMIFDGGRTPDTNDDPRDKHNLSLVRKVFGPPGTGKTYEACRIVAEWRREDECELYGAVDVEEEQEDYHNTASRTTAPSTTRARVEDKRRTSTADDEKTSSDEKDEVNGESCEAEAEGTSVSTNAEAAANPFGSTVWSSSSPSKSRPSTAQKILCVADSNVAADNLYRHLRQQHIGCVRFRSLGQAPPSSLIAKSISTGPPSTHLKNQGKGATAGNAQNLKLWREAVSQVQVVVTTCSGVGHAVFAGVAFPRVVIDEATQSTELSTLIALGRRCRELVLIGDPKQLPPTVLGQEVVGCAASTATSTPSATSTSSSLKTTLFDRVNVPPVDTIELLAQRRMHPDLLEFPNEHFYGGKLKTIVPVVVENGNESSSSNREDADAFIDGEHQGDRSGTTSSWSSSTSSKNEGFLFMRNRVSFVDSSSTCAEEEQEQAEEETVASTGSKRNGVEAALVAQWAHRFLAHDSAVSVAVLTPYSSQKELLEKTIKEKTPRLYISTVDGFQGSEADVVLLSLVRTKALGFVADRRRMNVALTRAKQAIVVFGSRTLLGRQDKNSKDVADGERSLWAEWIKRYDFKD
eukprot:GSA25T00016928001.1